MKRQEITDLIKNMSEQDVDSKLNELSETFKPLNNRPFLDMEGNNTLLTYKKQYLNSLMAFKIYIESGRDEKVAVDLGFKEIFPDAD